MSLWGHPHIFEDEKNIRESRGNGEVRINVGDKRGPEAKPHVRVEVHAQGWKDNAMGAPWDSGCRARAENQVRPSRSHHRDVKITVAGK